MTCLIDLRGRIAGAFAAVLLVSGCAFYSFTGAAIPQHIETVAVPLVEDATSNPITDLGGLLTQRLVDRFVGQTRLQLSTDEAQADALLRSEIRRYTVQPSAVGGQNRATLNRLTISVTATYADQAEDNQVFQRSFSSSVEYDPTDLASEEEAVNEILDNIADDIFTAATSNW